MLIFFLEEIDMAINCWLPGSPLNITQSRIVADTINN